MTTPAMRQYKELKSRYPDTVLFFRMGDFYEMFYEDARLASKVLGLALTSRAKGDQAIPLAGVPYHAVDNYLAKMIRAGYRVAICEQMEDPRPGAGAKGLLERDVVRVVTPGTLTDDALLEDKESNYLAAVLPAVVAPQGRARTDKQSVAPGLRTPSPGPEAALTRPAMQAEHRGHPLPEGEGSRPLPSRERGGAAAAPGEAPLVGLAWVELSTGKFFCEDCTPAAACDELARLGPAEVLLPEELLDAVETPEIRRLRAAADAPLVKRPAYVFDADDAQRRLCRHFNVATLDGLGVGDMPRGLCAAGAVLQYLEDTQKTALGHLRPLAAARRGNCLYLDQTTVRSLELVRSMRSQGQENTLLAVLDHARTPMGGRLLRQWIQFPLADVERINARLDAVEELAADKSLRDELRTRLDEVSDLERIIARVAVNRAGPRDLLGLARSLAQLPALKARLAHPGAPGLVGASGLADRKAARLAALERRIELLPDLRDLLERAIASEAPARTSDGGVIRAGFDAELDRLRGIRSSGARWLAEFQAREARRCGIATLKVGFNNIFGYYIEVTNTHREKIPADYLRKQTLKNAERYVTPELKEHEVEVLEAEEKSQARELELFDGVRREVSQRTAAIQAVADALAEVDLLATFAETAVRQRYARPQVDDSLDLVIEDSRHPVLEAALGADFVPNDCTLVANDCRMIILTGPNMAGKSIYIRQVALIVLLAQMGSFVPARRARVGVVDRIFTRVGASDELARGQSTFMVEMTETANILNNATERSLVILDEVGRGTSTFDGLALAWAITEHVGRHVRCRTLFATHYHELTELADLVPAARNFNVAVREWQDEVVFLHKIVPGGTDKSYGIHVARLAGVPRAVVDRAAEVLSGLEAQHVDLEGRSLLAQRASAAGNSVGAATEGESASQKSTAANSAAVAPAPAARQDRPGAARPAPDQLSLFEDTARVVIAELRKLNLDQLTPLEALMKLKELKDKT